MSMQMLGFVLAGTALLAQAATAQQVLSANHDDSAHHVVLAASAPAGVTHIESVAADTVRRRAKATEVSDLYEIRLRIHRYASYSTIPLFLAQTIAGNQLYQADQSGARKPKWAKSVHSAGAVGLGALFSLNTLTGLWNLWDTRGESEGRTKRWLHSGLMLASDAGFAYAGIKLSDDAEESASRREDHRNMAYYSMATALAGYGIMLIGDH
jgi:hypothetical protein